MAGNEFGKHKTLAIYDYFRQYVGNGDKENGVTVEDVLAYLRSVDSRYQFERKAIYSDIATISEYRQHVLSSMGKNQKKPWIEKKGKVIYLRNPYPDEFAMDEVHLLLDAVNASPMANDELAKKIKKYWPVFFKNDNYVSFLSCEHKKQSAVFSTLMNSLRRAIKEKRVLKINYGYKLSDEDSKTCIKRERKVSPVALYFTDNRYYLFAIDHAEMEKADPSLSEREAKLFALRQFRVDRIDSQPTTVNNADYIPCEESLVKEHIAGAVDAYSTGDYDDVVMTIRCDPPEGGTIEKAAELVLRAYNYIRDQIQIRSIIDENWQRGKMSFGVKVSPTSTFFAFLTNLSSFSTFEGYHLKVTVEPHADKQFKEKYEEFLRNAQANISFSEKDS